MPLKADSICPCGSCKPASDCHGNAIKTTDIAWSDADGRVWPVIVELSNNVLLYLTHRAKLLRFDINDAKQRHRSVATGFYGSVAYRNLKAVTTLVQYGQPSEAMSIVREICEAQIRCEYYTIFPEEAHRLVASRHVHKRDWIKQQNEKTLVLKVSDDELARITQLADADMLAYPEIFRADGKLWSEPDLKFMAERSAERAFELLPEANRVDWLRRAALGDSFTGSRNTELSKRMAASRSWMVNRLMSQPLHSTIQMIDQAFDWSNSYPLKHFDGKDESDGHEPLMLAIGCAIKISAAINVVSGHADSTANALYKAYTINKEALRAVRPQNVATL